MHRPTEDIDTEVEAIARLLAERGVTRGRILELACGLCPHGLRLAQRGLQVVGLDRSPAMLDVAGERVALAQASVEVRQGDVVDFSLPWHDFDAAIFMFETFPVISEQSDLLRHFDTVHRHLKRGGLYIIDLDA